MDDGPFRYKWSAERDMLLCQAVEETGGIGKASPRHLLSHLRMIDTTGVMGNITPGILSSYPQRLRHLQRFKNLPALKEAGAAATAAASASAQAASATATATAVSDVGDSERAEPPHPQPNDRLQPHYLVSTQRPHPPPLPLPASLAAALPECHAGRGSLVSSWHGVGLPQSLLSAGPPHDHYTIITPANYDRSAAVDGGRGARRQEDKRKQAEPDVAEVAAAAEAAAAEAAAVHQQADKAARRASLEQLAAAARIVAAAAQQQLQQEQQQWEHRQKQRQQQEQKRRRQEAERAQRQEQEVASVRQALEQAKARVQELQQMAGAARAEREALEEEEQQQQQGQPAASGKQACTPLLLAPTAAPLSVSREAPSPAAELGAAALAPGGAAADIQRALDEARAIKRKLEQADEDPEVQDNLAVAIDRLELSLAPSPLAGEGGASDGRRCSKQLCS